MRLKCRNARRTVSKPTRKRGSAIAEGPRDALREMASIFHKFVLFNASDEGNSHVRCEKNGVYGAIMIDDELCRFDAMHRCDRRTDRHRALAI